MNLILSIDSSSERKIKHSSPFFKCKALNFICFKLGNNCSFKQGYKILLKKVQNKGVEGVKKKTEVARENHIGDGKTES